MLKLKNVSKFYYSKGVVASGFSKLSLDLDMGEFVVITGESGSGKSTLLNVISGLDTYEEGEMYINGEETSHYNESDFETYRRKYIGNIFQHFNLVNSYTVYQNVELVLLINGSKSREVKNKIFDILRQVDMYKYRNTKVSKLSGGQKQRVAIARALAKDTPIIVADEPTGNLDSRSADSVLRILHEISKDKLVVLVTHNYDQVEEYATRKIKMHDGKIIEDKVIRNHNDKVDAKTVNYGEMTFLNKLKIGIRNTFNIIPKFLLLLLVYLFITIAVTAEYSSLQKKEDENSKIGYNQFFNNTLDNRIVIKKSDNSVITEDDYKRINELNNIKSIVKDDLLLDMYTTITDENFYYYAKVSDVSFFEGKVDKGRLPLKDDEIIIAGYEGDYYLTQEIETLFNGTFLMQNQNNNEDLLDYKLKIVGIKYIKNNINDIYGNNGTFYVSKKVLNDLRKSLSQEYSTIKTTLNNKVYEQTDWSSYYKVVANSKVPKGKAFVSEEMNMVCKKYKCINSKMTIDVENIYYKDSMSVKISKTYNKDNFKKITGLKNFDNNNGAFYVNPDDYYALFNKGNFQSSVFVTNTKIVQKTIDDLKSLGYKTVYVKDTLVDITEDVRAFIDIFRVVLIAILTIGLFFVSYFIIKLILKSRNIYFSTIRILGSSKKIAKRLLDIELLTVINVAYVIFVIFVVLVKNDIVNSDYIKDLTEYLKIVDYAVIYFILIFMSWLISNRFAKKIFKSSAMNTYREEV